MSFFLLLKTHKVYVLLEQRKNHTFLYKDNHMFYTKKEKNQHRYQF